MRENKTAQAMWRRALVVLVVLTFSILLAGGIFQSLKASRLDQSMKTQLIANKRNDPVAWAGMAQELEQKGDLIDAERAYRKAIQLKPDYKHAWLGLGKILEKQGKGTDAKAVLRRADELNTDSQK